MAGPNRGVVCKVTIGGVVDAPDAHDQELPIALEAFVPPLAGQLVARSMVLMFESNVYPTAKSHKNVDPDQIVSESPYVGYP